MKYKDTEIKFDIDNEGRLVANFCFPCTWKFQGLSIQECVKQIKEAIDNHKIPIHSSTFKENADLGE